MSHTRLSSRVRRAAPSAPGHPGRPTAGLPGHRTCGCCPPGHTRALQGRRDTAVRGQARLCPSHYLDLWQLFPFVRNQAAWFIGWQTQAGEQTGDKSTGTRGPRVTGPWSLDCPWPLRDTRHLQGRAHPQRCPCMDPASSHPSICAVNQQPLRKMRGYIL